MTVIKEIDELISSVRSFFALPGNPKFTTPQYREFHDNLTDFIYRNQLDKDENWDTISQNLIYKSTQFMTSNEANKILICLENLKRLLLYHKYEQFWKYIHPKIEGVARSRFYSGMYADAIEASFKEINNRVKKIVKTQTGREFDGSPLMEQAFSSNTPILTIQGLATETERNIQLGYMKIFSGAMIGIRNPKAHDNQTITREDAIRKLNFASLLMFKIDQAITTTGIQE